MSPYQDKIAVVTGAGSGIGQALCLALGQAGAWVVAVDIAVDGLRTTVAEIEALGGLARMVVADVADERAVQQLIDETVAEHGSIDYLFNNAGMTVVGEVRDMTTAQWRRILDVNLGGIVNGVMAAYPRMVKQGYGHIVNTASGMGLSPSPLFTAYSTTKYAAIGLSTGLRAEAEALGVKVSVVCPGFVRTGMFDSARFLKSNREDLLRHVPFKIRESAGCADAILRGVARNEAIILYPFYVRFFWWVYWFAPGLLSYFDRQKMRTFRQLRDNHSAN